MIWFTADPHFGHTNIIKFCNRPFQSIEEHDRAIVDNWNALVSPKDTVYLLGDIGLQNPEYLRKTLARLKGQIHFIRGNHDKSSILDIVGKRFASIKDVHFFKTYIKDQKQEIFLSHYAHRTWPKSNHGSWHLFGHSHGNLPPHGLSCDVGVDCWNYFPVSIEELQEKMQSFQVVLDYIPD